MTTRARAGGQPPVPATAKGEATRAFLLGVAARVFAERGYAATTLSELIAASGLTKGAFYFYFRSKAELAMAVLDDQQARWLDRVRTRVLASPSAAEQLSALVPAMLDLIESDPAAWSITRLTKELAGEPELADRVCAPMSAWVALVTDVVRRGQQDGTLRADVDPDAVGVVLVGAFDGLKTLTDVLDHDAGPERFRALLRSRARTLLVIVEAALAPRDRPLER